MTIINFINSNSHLPTMKVLEFTILNFIIKKFLGNHLLWIQFIPILLIYRQSNHNK